MTVARSLPLDFLLRLEKAPPEQVQRGACAIIQAVDLEDFRGVLEKPRDQLFLALTQFTQKAIEAEQLVFAHGRGLLRPTGLQRGRAASAPVKHFTRPG